MKKRGCGCKMKMIDGRAGGATCELAKFKAWKPREIARLATKGLFSSLSAAKLAAEVIGTDMTEKEHMLFIGVDTRNRVVAIGDGSSTEKHMCQFRLIDAVAAMLASAKVPGEVAAVLMAHNHPGGTPYPSEDDVLTTKNVAQKFKLVTFLDHCVVYYDSAGNPQAYSFFEEQPHTLKG